VFAGVSYVGFPEDEVILPAFQKLRKGGRIFLMPLAGKATATNAYHYRDGSGRQLWRQAWRVWDTVQWLDRAGFVNIKVRGLTGWSERVTPWLPLWLAKAVQWLDLWT